MVTDPGRIVGAFGPILGTCEVLPIEPGRWLTFEYIGDEDLLHEAVDGHRTRGARCTSVDAAFLHRTQDGVAELVLVEWKYTESYGPRKADPAKDAVRLRRYGALLEAPDGPIRTGLLSFEELVNEPLYQLADSSSSRTNSRSRGPTARSGFGPSTCSPSPTRPTRPRSTERKHDLSGPPSRMSGSVCFGTPTGSYRLTARCS